MHSHHLTQAIADVRAADLHGATARSGPAADRSRRRRAIAVALIAICGLAPTAVARAQPADDAPAFTTRAPAVRAGDTPVDFPNASRAPDSTAPTTISVVRPERTVVEDADQVIPIALAGLAVLIALGTTGYTVIRLRGVPGRLF